MKFLSDFETFPDVYYNPDYCKLYEESENGVCETFEYSDENGCVVNVFIKRPVPWMIDGVQYFDIVTPYGYGGPLVIHSTNKQKLIKAFLENWMEYCKKENIVCEFVRFHPLLQNYLDFKKKG